MILIKYLFVGIAFMALSAFAATPGSLESSKRLIKFTYKVELPSKQKYSTPLDIFVPLAQTGEHQRVLKREFSASSKSLLQAGKVKKEKKYGNEYWYLHLDKAPAPGAFIEIRYLVERSLLKNDDLSKAKA